ncbi:MAG: hypothetical protein ABSA11_09730 [Candidatus Bathyarchaeia archaeon]
MAPNPNPNKPPKKHRYTHSTKPLMRRTIPGEPSLTAEKATASIEIRLRET